MPSRLNSLLNSPRVARVSDRLALAWNWLRRRFHHNPGFVLAALAGTLGLILAVVLLLQGGYKMLVASQDLANRSTDESKKSVSSKAAASKPVAEDDDDEHFSLHHTGQSKPVVDEEDPEWEPKPLKLLAQSKSVTSTSKSQAVGFSDDEPIETVTPTPISKARTKVVAAPNSSAADELDESEPEELKTKTTARTSDKQQDRTAVKPAPRLVPRRATFTDDEPVIETADSDHRDTADKSKSVAVDNDLESESEPIGSANPTSPPVAPTVANQTPRWGTAKSRPAARTESPTAVGQSRSVETVIYSAPGSSAPEAVPANDFVVPERTRQDDAMRVQMKAPQRATAGEPVVLGFRVTNTTGAAIRNLVLSVELPPGLTHREGRSLEHSIDRIEPGATHPARLTVHAAATGSQRPRALVTSGGARLAEAEAAIEIASPSRRVRGAVAECCGVPVR